MTKAYCHCCERSTETVFLALSSGHIGNCCAICRAMRKRRPYVKKAEFLRISTPTTERSQGETTQKAIQRYCGK